MSVEAFNYLITATNPNNPNFSHGFRLRDLAQSGVVWGDTEREEALGSLSKKVGEILATSDQSFSSEHPFGKPEDVGPLALYLLSCATRTTRTREDGYEEDVWITGRGLIIYSTEHAGWIAAVMLKTLQKYYIPESYPDGKRPEEIVQHYISLLKSNFSPTSKWPVCALNGNSIYHDLSYLTFLKHCANFPSL